MKIVIDIPDNIYDAIKSAQTIVSGQRSGKTLLQILVSSVENGTPLPKNHGDLIGRQAVLDIFGDIHPLDYNARAYVAQIEELPSAEWNLKEKFDREIEIANKDIDFAEGTDENEENYMRGYLGGILCAYRIVFGKNYEEKTE